MLAEDRADTTGSMRTINQVFEWREPFDEQALIEATRPRPWYERIYRALVRDFLWISGLY